jgi:hypothetical protein
VATLPKQIQPGDIISSELMNAILARLAALGEAKPGGTQSVPNVLGTRLVDARALITQPSTQLALGFVIDVSGAAVDPLAGANSSLIVLNQSPVADTRVVPNTSVNLVVSQTSTGGTTPGNLPPTITRTETPTGTVTTTFPVNGTMIIVGTNFSANAAENKVTFDNTTANVTVDPADPTRRLVVIVPTGIPGAPVNPGDAARPGVVVSVQTATGAPATTTVTVSAPAAQQPTITSVTPATQFEGNNITIAGTNFAPEAQVVIRGTTAAVVSRTSTQIVATVPDFPDINSGALVPASLTVSVPDVGDATFTGTFRVRGA